MVTVTEMCVTEMLARPVSAMRGSEERLPAMKSAEQWSRADEGVRPCPGGHFGGAISVAAPFQWQSPQLPNS
jgi:hypothetical protein